MRLRRTPLLTSCALLACVGSGPVSADGAALYATHCVACHQPDGNGAEGLAPAGGRRAGQAARCQAARGCLAGNGFRHGRKITSRGVNYDGNMPAVALTDEEMSSVMGYVLTTFNAGSQNIPAALFAKARGKRLQAGGGAQSGVSEFVRSRGIADDSAPGADVLATIADGVAAARGSGRRASAHQLPAALLGLPSAGRQRQCRKRHTEHEGSCRALSATARGPGISGSGAGHHAIDNHRAMAETTELLNWMVVA
ncbi:MAG: cytochrome c [Sulfuritalea sp.]|nr:cytochrome c [Sulfuritalea sp.]